MAEELKVMSATILSIVVIAVVLVIGIYINATMETITDTDGTAATAVNESLVRPTTAGITLATGADLRNGACGTITAVYNTTNDIAITSGNYTQVGCLVTNKTSDATLGATWKYNYPYTWSNDSTASLAAAGGVTALSNGTPWLTIIIVVAFAAIVLGFLMSGFKKSAPQAIAY